MRGLKIQNVWIRKILSGEKTMEVRSRHYDVLGQRLALGNSGNGLVEGYAVVQEIIEIPLTNIPKYESKHLATKWLLSHYGNKDANIRQKEEIRHPLRLLFNECQKRKQTFHVS